LTHVSSIYKQKTSKHPNKIHILQKKICKKTNILKLGSNKKKWQICLLKVENPQ
jgi:hypothetical protein